MISGDPKGFSRKTRSLLGLLLATLLLSSCMGRKEAAGDLDDRPVVSIMAPLHFPHAPDPAIIDEIEKLTNTRLDIEWVPDGIYSDKMNTSLMTNSLKKATFVKYTDYNLVKNSVRSGAFWEIGPYLDRFPNLRQLDEDILNQSALDGKIYGLYTERLSSRQGIIIREDWLERLKLGKPRTIDELYEVMKAFTYEDPDGNGKADTFGLADRNDLIFGVFKTLSSYFGTPNNWLVSGHELIPEFATPQYMDTMNFMRKLYEQRIINQDFAVTSKEVQRNLFIRGQVGVYIGSMLDVQRLADAAELVNPEARFALVNRIEGPLGYRIWSIPNFNGLYLFSKKAIKTEEELLQTLEFFDRSMEKDVANLMKYGFEGRHYKLEGNQVVLPEDSQELRANELSVLYTLMIADLSNPNIMKVAKQDSLTETAERLSEDNEKFIVRDPTEGLKSKTYDEKNVELYKIISDATYNYMLGHLDEAGYRQEIERWKRSGGSKVIQEYTQDYFGNGDAG
ncbi:extracellular solute-binding protein [Cohnella cholangitidis]|uniref:Extracellular solute-binding protein n=1 Tax=Cohnella cholangitidis TaxID=2598458 RepID=A0A7G5BY29_9BACL|nr:extracellular solute-binding protein [Cohnella cholangitidis]QMV41863.1 extracellular solute-binding protein [Cohnella cholangitidis]